MSVPLAGAPGSGANLLHKHDGELLQLITPLGILAFASVVIRFATKLKTKTGITADDWFCVAAFVTYVGWWYIELAAYLDGVYGVPLELLPIPVLIRYLKFNYASPIINVTSITLAKVSILLLYYRIFPTTSFRRGVWLVGAFCVGWGIGADFASIFRCLPVQSNWDVLGPPGKCVNWPLFFLISEPFNMLSDLFIVLLPINVIRKLQLPLRKKFQLSIIFAVGLFVTAISMARLIITSTSVEKIASQEAAKWLLVQTTLSCVCISLPTYGPLLGAIALERQRLRSWYASLLSRTSRSSRTTDAYSTAHRQESGSIRKIYSKEARVTNASSSRDIPLEDFSPEREGTMV